MTPSCYCYYPGCVRVAARDVGPQGTLVPLNFCPAHLPPTRRIEAFEALSQYVETLEATGDEDDTDWISMHSGARLTLCAPRIEDIRIEDMALGLAREPRFSGQTDCTLEPYSVAQHSVLVAMRCPPEDQKWAALHDGSEGIGYRDIPRPFKRTSYMRGYRRAEKIAMHAIADAFSLPHEMPASVKRADLEVFEMEQAFLMRGDVERSRMDFDLTPWSWRTAWVNYLNLCADIGLAHVVHGPVHRATATMLFGPGRPL